MIDDFVVLLLVGSASLTLLTRLENDIAEIRERLDLITGLLQSASQNVPVSTNQDRNHASADQGLAYASVEQSSPMVTVSPASRSGFISDYDASTFPVMTIQSQPMMRLLGLDSDIAGWLSKAEQTAALASTTSMSGANVSMSRMFLLQPNRIESAVQAFSQRVHIWFPIFSADFPTVLSNTLGNSHSAPLESCLALLVIAVGSLVELEGVPTATTGRPDLAYFEAAVALLPMAIQSYTLVGLQCLIVFAIHQMCLLRPCQAHDYIAMASFRAQNMLRSRLYSDDLDRTEDLRRAFWAILLIESELNVQLDLPFSGIWAYEDIPYPTASSAWHYEPSPRPDVTPSAHSQSCSPHSNASLDSSIAYFLAQIAMRRMLQRCTTSVSKSAGGQLRYAPVIAGELESQLNEWYECLPAHLRFHTTPTRAEQVAMSPTAQFLQTQYSACRASIFWPAVYQTIELGMATEQEMQYCSWFSDAYLSFMVSAKESLSTCAVNIWTLVAR